MVYQLSQAIEATTWAGKIADNAQQRAYAAPTLSQLNTYAYGGRISNGLAPLAGGGVRFYDDNAWTGVALVTLYRQTGQRRYLDAAKQEWQFEQTGQRRGANGSDTGLWWNTGRPYVSSGSTGGAIRLALMLYHEDHDPAQLAFAKRNYAWARRHLENAGNLYIDGNDGIVSPAHQAWFIDDGRLLYQVTRNRSYLTQATKTANAAATRFASTYTNFSAAQFADLYASLFRLDRSNSVYADALRAYVKHWIAPHTTSGSFHYPGAGSNCNETIVQQAGASWVFTLRANA